MDTLPFKRTTFGKHIKQQLSINATRSSTHPSFQHTNATGAGRGGETAEGALGPLSPAGTWQGSSSPPRRPGSPEDSERDTSYSPRSPGCRFTGNHSPPALQEGGVEVAGWGLINLVTQDGGNVCRDAHREGGASFLQNWNQPDWVQTPSLLHLSWVILGRRVPFSMPQSLHLSYRGKIHVPSPSKCYVSKAMPGGSTQHTPGSSLFIA